MAILATLGAGLFVGLAALAAASWLFGGHAGFFNVDGNCADNQFSCGALLNLFTTLLAGALAFVSFSYWRAHRVVRRHLRAGRDEPWRIVPTATPMSRVVGREGICEIIEDDLCQHETRRPQIIVGGVGEGKTAVLVRLTQLLVERGAVPVPVQLRDAETSLDFLELAKKRFRECVEPRVLSEDEGDKVWRKFWSDGRIVVLADGLEEALLGSDSRESAIRRGVERAKDAHLPLVIASRPDNVLRNLDAALIQLEPLSASAAVEYIRSARGGDEKIDLERFVERAGVTEAPLFLHLAGVLHDKGQLESLALGDGRLSLRIQLLEGWRECLRRGVRGEAHLLADRERALEGLEVMACDALTKNCLEVELDDASRSSYVRAVSGAAPAPGLVANVGEDLELVERVGRKVRFRHSIMEAYLGAQCLRSVLEEDLDGYLDVALENPGRELLMALAMCCHGREGEPLRRRVRVRLEQEALKHSGGEAFDLLAGAYEIDAMTGGEGSVSLSHTTGRLWELLARDEGPAGDVKVNEAKLRAISRMAEAGDEPTCEALWRVCLEEDVYRVRLGAAQALASAGGMATRALEPPIDEALALQEELTAVDGGMGPSRGAVRRGSLHGWILPSLLDTSEQADVKSAGCVRGALDSWIELAGERLHLGVESCLAQGFKHAANRLPHRTDPRTQAELIEMAERLLMRTTWWYSQLTLLQALTLWSLGADPDRRAKIGTHVAHFNAPGQHPFVREAAGLCTETMRAPKPGGQDRPDGPSHYIWIDETGVVTRIGSRAAVPDPESTAGLWIPPAAGWHSLTPRAQRLVAEVLVYLNLIEGGDDDPETAKVTEAWSTARSTWREGRRRKVAGSGPELPRCIAYGADRDNLLDPTGRGVVGRCGCACGFDLCPYPKRSERPFRGELTETFCREQKRILRARAGGKLPRWNQYDSVMPVRRARTARDGLTRFWSRMEDRIARIGT